MTKQILIVDDEPNVVMPIQFLMEQQGYRVMINKKKNLLEDLVNKAYEWDYALKHYFV